MNLGLRISLLAAFACCSACSMPSLPSISWPVSSVKADLSAEALYEEGNRYFNEKKFVRAIDSFSKLRTDYPFSPMLTQVELKIADAYYLNEQYPEAINAFKEFQSMHPTNENIPFVTLRLGQAHFNQFTSTDRDQKNTEIAKGYFETVIAKYPGSPQAAEAKVKLQKCLEYLAEHDYSVAWFYYQQEKYPAARDRFEEIVRKYKGTPTAVKSLFYLGESYNKEKNSIKASLAYEALIQHYPESKFAGDARTQLAAVEKEKRDPMAMLLMRDRRPSGSAAPEVKEDPALAKLKDVNLIAKTEVVDEKPGDDKTFFRRVADKLNPFSSSSDSPKKEDNKNESAEALLAKRQAPAPKKQEESTGILTSLCPFGSKDASPTAESKNNAFVGQVDSSLKQKGIDVAATEATLKPPPADLPPPPPAKPQSNIDTATLVSSIDANLSKGGKNGSELPPTPEIAEGFRNLAATQERVAKATPTQPQDVQSSGILSAIDQKLKAQGVQGSEFEKPPTPEEIKAAAAKKPQASAVELEPKLALEKGPLFLNLVERPAVSESPETNKDAPKSSLKGNSGADVAYEPPSRVLVKGPVQAQATAAGTNPPAPKKPTTNQEDEPKGALDQIRQDIESVGKVLNPFSW